MKCALAVWWLAQTVTDDAGFYSIDGLDPATDVDIVFIDPETGTVMGGIQGLTLVAGSNLVDQNLPLDPSGVVYDFATGDPVAGATVTLTDTSGALLPVVCLIDASQQTQVTGTDGVYRFDLIPGADAACPIGETEYLLEVVLPGGVPPIFGFPAEGTPLDATTCSIDAIPGGRCQVFDRDHGATAWYEFDLLPVLPACERRFGCHQQPYPD